MKTKMIKLITLLFGTTFLFIGCAERPIYQLKSLDENINFKSRNWWFGFLPKI